MTVTDDPVDAPTAPPPADRGGHRRVDLLGTAVFAVTARAEASCSTQWTRAVGVTVALVLFAIGVRRLPARLRRAVQRSRTDEIAVASSSCSPGPRRPSQAVAPRRADADCSPCRSVARPSRHRRSSPAQPGRPRHRGARAGVRRGAERAVGGPIRRFGPRIRDDAPPPAPSSTGRVTAAVARWSRMPTMAESATQTITIAASPEHCFAVAVDFERYPEWAKDVKEAVVRRPTTQGRATEVEFRASALGRSTHYTLAYDYWRRRRCCRGSWCTATSCGPSTARTTSRPTADGGTDVRYDLSIELVVPLPGFVKRRAEVRILNTIHELKSRAEARRSPPASMSVAPKCFGVVVDDAGNVVRERSASDPSRRPAADRGDRVARRGRSPPLPRLARRRRARSGHPRRRAAGVAERRRRRRSRRRRPRSASGSATRSPSTTTPRARRSPSGSSAPVGASTTSSW